jgi:hypothetical protein
MTTATDPAGPSALAPPHAPLAAKLGAASYAVWALLHLQDARNLACFSAAGIGVALTLNWRNNRWGWINLAVIGVADIGFIIFVLLPGYLPPWPGLLEPLVWLVGLALTTISLAQGRQR